ncbi:uncharacterized protein [Nicotiana tomentosiformis]|uniref:uncharacterized protein n=1 Tax=Nicotiana tomentosiformis TaxID=4098 RepID=UPI00388CE39B
MHTTETEGVELASYRLKEVAYSLWEESREEGSPPVRWGEFTDAFMDRFLPAETKASRATEFESLKQGSMGVWDYHMEFMRLSKYAIHMLPTMEARVHRFIQGLSPLVMNEAATAALNSDMNYGKMVAFAQATENRKLKTRMEREGSSKARFASNFGGSSGGGNGWLAFRGGSSGPSQSFSQSLMSAQPSRPSQQQWSHFKPSHGNRGPHQQGRSRGRCDMRGNIQRDCRSSRRIMGRGVVQPASSVATTSITPPARGTPAPARCGAARGGAQNSRGPNRFYAMRRRRDSEASPDVVTGILTV